MPRRFPDFSYQGIIERYEAVRMRNKPIKALN